MISSACIKLMHCKVLPGTTHKLMSKREPSHLVGPTSYICGHPDSQWRLSSVAGVLFAVCYTCNSNYIALAGITVLTGLPVVLSMSSDKPAALIYIELACRVRKGVFVKGGPMKTYRSEIKLQLLFLQLV